MLPYLLPIIPSETISSYSSAVMVFSGKGMLPHSLSSEGQKIGGAMMHSVVVSMARFCAATEGRLGSPEYLLMNHSEYPYYTVACSIEVAKSLAARIISESSGRLHLPRLRPPIELERTRRLFCPLCREAQLDEFCRTGQLTIHALPLVQACPLHGETLFEDLPDGTTRAVLAARMHQCRRAANRFAGMSSRLLAMSTLSLAQEFRGRIRDKLRASGFLREDGTLRASQLDDAMRRYYCDATFDIRLRQLATVSQRASRTAHNLIGAEVRSQHPVLVVLLAMFLEDEGASLLASEREFVRPTMPLACL